MYEKFDQKEIQLPETMFIRDIETRVFQSMVMQSLSRIEGVALIEGSLFDSLLGREVERVKGIHVTQHEKEHSVDVRLEIRVAYGINIPLKAEEVQNRIVEEVSRWTGLRVASVHVIFKDLILPREEMSDVAGTLEEVF